MRLQSLLLALSLLAGLVISAAPASAALVPGTSSVDVRDVLAGTQQAFVFTVANAGETGTLPIDPTDSTINWVRIGPKFLDGSTFTVANGSAAGWTFDVTPTGLARFRGGELAPGDSQQFTVFADAVIPAQDLAGDWVVEVSDANGASPAKSIAAAPGALTTTIRVLNIDALAFTDPAGVLDNTLTSGQDNVSAQSVVSNHGSAALTVTPSLGTSGGDSVTSVTPETATIAPGATQAFDFALTMGGATSGTSTRTLTGDASATGADALDRQSAPFSVENAASFAYDVNTLTPEASSSGVSQTFTLALDKTNPPSVELAPSTTLTFTKVSDPSKTFSTTLASAPATGRGTQTVGLIFEPVTIPGPLAGDGSSLDGLWTPSLDVAGTDDNGAAVSDQVDISDSFEIDNLVPVPLPTLSAPNANEFGQDVVKDGQTLTFGGQIKRGAGDADPVDPTATITQCDLVILSPALTEVGRINVPIGSGTCANNAGTISGSAEESFAIPAGYVRLDVAAADTAGNTSPSAPSNLVAIDNVAPTIVTPEGAVTGCGPQGAAAAATCAETRTVRAFFTEGVKGSATPLDFSVQGNVVTGVAMRYISEYNADGSGPDQTEAGEACTATTFCNVAILTLQSALAEDAKPTVQYRLAGLPVPGAPSRDRFEDAPTTAMADWAQTAADGIVPDLPNLDAVSQSGVDDNGGSQTNYFGNQGGGYFTNQTSPTFRITGLATGYTAIIALDTNANGDYDGVSDTDVARCVASGATVDCVATSALAANTTYPLLITSLDPEGNLAQGKSGAVLGKHARAETLTVDLAAPNATAFAAAPTAAAVTFSEELGRGRDFGEDWIPFIFVDGRRSRFVAGSVSGSGPTRTIGINDPDYAGTLDGIQFAYSGPASERYQDKAGNYLSDFTL